jgi:transglutaminase-like putative cysteine protease
VSLGRRVRLEVLILAVLAIAAFCVSQRSFGMFLFASGLAILSWYVTEGPRGRRLPKWLSLATLGVIVANACWEWFLRPDPSEAMSILGRFSMWLTVLKLYESRGARDDAQLLALTAVLVISGTLETIDLLFAVLLVAYGLDVMRVAMLIELASVAASASVGSAADGGPASGRRFTRSLRRTVGFTLAGATVTAMVVFAVFPRRLDADPRRPFGGGPVSGFVDEVDLFSGERITESRREVFSVRWIDRQGESVRFPQPMLLRGAVMDRYQVVSNRWIPARGPSQARTVTVREDLPMTPLSIPSVRPRSETYRQQVEMRSMSTATAFAAFAPIGVHTEERRTFAIDERTLVVREIGLDQVSRLQSYEVQIEPYPGPETLAPLLGRRGGAVPSLPEFPIPEIREIALELLSDLVDGELPTADQARADPEVRWERNRIVSRAFASWLQDTARFRYTTDLRDFIRLDGEDPIVAFLQRHRFGHCEYFASALVALCRSVGVDARLVTGFVAMEWDPGTRQYLVRESNAHAWVEVRTGRFLWSSIDPTPPESLESIASSGRGWFDRFRWIYDRAELFWSSRVISYDGAVQASLAERLGREFEGAGDRVAAWLDDGRSRLAQRLSLGRTATVWFLAVSATLMAGAAAGALVLRRRRRVRRRSGLPRSAPAASLEAASVHLETMDLWDRAGLAPASWQPPRAFLQSLGASWSEAVALSLPIVDLHYRSRFAGEVPTSTQLGDVRQRLERLRILLRRPH